VAGKEKGTGDLRNPLDTNTESVCLAPLRPFDTAQDRLGGKTSDWGSWSLIVSIRIGDISRRRFAPLMRIIQSEAR